jgi:beta-galactosidase/beta-glucuronidase
MRSLLFTALLAAAALSAPAQAPPSPPLPEHPRPDFERAEWLNLNGSWGFRFDPDDLGLDRGWAGGEESFEERITVPFPWGSPLSGVEDGADIGWYLREIEVPAEWSGRRVFLNVGASEWHTTAWLDGVRLG